MNSDKVFEAMETAMVFTLTNPVTAGTKTVLGVLSNPFRSERKSAAEYYFSQRRFSNKVEKIDKAVRACEHCDAKPFGVSTRYRKAGSLSVYYPYEPYEKSTFCDEHVDEALAAQRIVAGARGL